MWFNKKRGLTAFAQILDWTDTECEKFDKGNHFFPIKFSRDLYRRFNELHNDFDCLYKAYNILRDIVFKGKISKVWYEIKCPHCHTTYSIPLYEMNEDKVQCLDCHKHYHQHKNIERLLFKGDRDEGK